MEQHNDDNYVDLNKLGLSNSVETVEHKYNLTKNLLFLHDFIPNLKLINAFLAGYITYIITKILAEKELETFEVINLVFDILRKYYKFKTFKEQKGGFIELEDKKVFAYSYVENYFERLNKNGNETKGF